MYLLGRHSPLVYHRGQPGSLVDRAAGKWAYRVLTRSLHLPLSLGFQHRSPAMRQASAPRGRLAVLSPTPGLSNPCHVCHGHSLRQVEPWHYPQLLEQAPQVRLPPHAHDSLSFESGDHHSRYRSRSTGRRDAQQRPSKGAFHREAGDDRVADWAQCSGDIISSPCAGAVAGAARAASPRSFSLRCA